MFPLDSLCVTAGDGCDGYLHTATAIIKTVTAVTNCHGQPIESEVQSCVHREYDCSCKQCRTRLKADLRYLPFYDILTKRGMFNV